MVWCKGVVQVYPKGRNVYVWHFSWYDIPLGSTFTVDYSWQCKKSCCRLSLYVCIAMSQITTGVRAVSKTDSDVCL